MPTETSRVELLILMGMWSGGRDGDRSIERDKFSIKLPSNKLEIMKAVPAEQLCVWNMRLDVNGSFEEEKSFGQKKSSPVSAASSADIIEPLMDDNKFPFLFSVISAHNVFENNLCFTACSSAGNAWNAKVTYSHLWVCALVAEKRAMVERSPQTVVKTISQLIHKFHHTSGLEREKV